jgi:hypothetical protein
MVMSATTRIDWTPASRDGRNPDPYIAVQLRSHGDDAWRKDHIACTVWSGELRGMPGTIDSVAQKALTLARL